MSTRSIILSVVLLGVITISLLLWEDEPDHLAIMVQPSGAIMIEGKEIAPGALDEELKARARDSGKLAVTIMASEALPAGQVVPIIAAAESAGAFSIEIVADKESP